LINKLRSNLKALYRYIKSKQKIIPGIDSLEKSDCSLTAGDQDVAETLNRFSESTLTTEYVSIMCLFPPLHLRPAYVMLIILNITESMVLQKLMELKVNKAPGPDGLHPYFFNFFYFYCITSSFTTHNQQCTYT